MTANLKLASTKSTSGITSRTFADRNDDAFNVMDFGAVGTGTPTALSTRYGSLAAAQSVYPFVASLSQECDYAAIQLAINTMWASPHKGGTVFHPPGNYLTNTAIDIGNHESGSNNTNGRIVGVSRYSSYINGNVPNGMIFYQDDGVNGPGEISDLALINTSDWIGSGGLRLSNSTCAFNRVQFGGMISVLLPFNIYDVRFNSCSGGASSNATTGYNGTLGIAGSTFSISGWRSTNPLMTAFTLQGSDTAHMSSIGVENVVVAFLIGAKTGWASHCTVSGDVLTVGGTVASTDVANPQFSPGQILFGKGLDLPTWANDPFDSTGGVTITDDNSTDGTLTGTGFAGTYRISGSYTISTPVPMWTRQSGHTNCVDVSAVQGEANFCQVYIENLGGGTFENMGAGGTVIECVDQWGVTGLTARCGFYIRQGTAFTLKGCVPAANNYQGTFVISPSANLDNVSFISCTGKKFENNVTTATIKNAAGTGAGNVLNVTTFTSGSGIGVGMKVYDGSSLLTTITKNNLLDATYTGSITTGTYEVADSLNISSRTLTIHTGEGWVVSGVPDAAKAAVKFINCGTSNMPSGATDGLENWAMTFTCLPGQAGSSGNVSLHPGSSFFIVDAQKSGTGTAAPGDIVIGGGSQKIPVFYDGTDWRYGGGGSFI